MKSTLTVVFALILSSCDCRKDTSILIADTPNTVDQNEDEKLLPVPSDMQEMKSYLRVDRHDLQPGDIYLSNKDFNVLIRNINKMTRIEIQDFLRVNLKFKER